DSAVVKVMGGPETTGRDALQAEYQKMFDMMSNMKSNASRVWMTKDGPVVVEWAAAGKHSNDMMGIKATEKDIGMMGVSAMWFTPDGNKIKEEQVYQDMGTGMSQIGVSKQKARPVPAVPSGSPEVFTATGSEDTKNADAMNKMMAAFEKKSEADFIGG